MGASMVELRAQARPPGTEFLDAETGRQKSPLRRANAHRDKDLRNEWPEIPAETPYLALCRKHAVCKDWMVVCAVRYEPVSDCNSLIMAVLQGIFAKYGLLHKTARKLRSHFKSLCANSLEKLAGNFLI
jgi:hypothetical protein